MKFLIVGVGNIGLRHLQGLTNLPDNQIEFYLLDKDYSYKKRFKKEIKEINQNYSLKENINIDELEKIKFELVIISTTASDRSKILFEILNKINTKYILIEKPICQSVKELEELRKITKKKIFVNFPRRYCDWHKNIKNKLDTKSPTIFDVGGNVGESIELFLNIFEKPNIYSFEPEISSFKKLKERYEKNKEIHLYNLAFGNKKERLNLKINVKSSTSTFSTINTKSKYYKLKSLILGSNKNKVFFDEEKVQVDTVDSFCSEKKIQNINILKIVYFVTCN